MITQLEHIIMANEFYTNSQLHMSLDNSFFRFCLHVALQCFNSCTSIFAMDIMQVYMICVCRNLVSASQDGKLIVWDGYTTNKVRLADCS